MSIGIFYTTYLSKCVQILDTGEPVRVESQSHDWTVNGLAIGGRIAEARQRLRNHLLSLSPIQKAGIPVAGKSKARESPI